MSLLPKPLWELYLYLTDKKAAGNRLMLPACIRETVTAEIGKGLCLVSSSIQAHR